MARAYLLPGVTIAINGSLNLIKRKFEDGVIETEEESTGKTKSHHENDLLEQLRVGRMHIVVKKRSVKETKRPEKKVTNKLWDSLEEDLKARARLRYEYVLDAIEGPLTRTRIKLCIKQTAARIAAQVVPSESSVIRWIGDFIHGGRDVLALVPDNRNKGNRNPRLPVRVQELVDVAIEVKYLKRERGTINDTLYEAIDLIAAENRQKKSGEQKLTLPKYSYVRARIKLIPPEEKVIARYGRDYAMREFRGRGSVLEAERILSNVEIDHTLMDVIVICDKTAIPLGRPWLTVVTDTYSRAILGFYLSFEAPSYFSVAMALMHAVMPKTYLRETYPNLKNDWGCYGIPEMIAVDNGPEFHSEAFEDALRRFGTVIKYMPRKTAWYKGKVERLIQSLNRGSTGGIPGKTFGNILDKEDYDPDKHSVVSLSNLEEVVHLWVVDIYHAKTHRIINTTPKAMWERGASITPIPLPVELIDIETAFGVPEERVMVGGRVELSKIDYCNDISRDLSIRLGGKVTVQIKRIPYDLGYLYILDPLENCWIKVEASSRHKEYATGLSTYQHELCMKYVKNQFNVEVDIESLAAAKKAISNIVADAMNMKKRLKAGMKKIFRSAAQAKEPKLRRPPESARNPSVLREVSANAQIDTTSNVRRPFYVPVE